MKRLILIGLLALAGCGGGSDDAAPPPPEDNTGAPPENQLGLDNLLCLIFSLLNPACLEDFPDAIPSGNMPPDQPVCCVSAASITTLEIVEYNFPTVTLQWELPTTMNDGSAVIEYGGPIIHFSMFPQRQGSIRDQTLLNSPEITVYTVDLPASAQDAPGTWHIMMTSHARGEEGVWKGSSVSNIVSVEVL